MFCACAQVDKALQDDIAEMLIVGFRGTELKKDNHIVRDIEKYHIGGVILFEYDAPSGKRPRNITSAKQVKKLCQDLQGLGEETLFISIDQEGGRVNRLKEKYGFPHFESPEASAKGGSDSVRCCARNTAEVLHNMGINLNFAPCTDVNTNPDCPIIGKLGRSFSSDPSVVAQYAQIWIEEQQKQGVVSCLKHFPGHGSSLADTHLGLADVSDTWDELELVPYKKLIGSNKADSNGTLPYMIMTTHVFNKNWDEKYPATLSKKVLTDMLRDSLHYQGIIITDDLAMGAMAQQYEYADMLELTLNAGADMLCLSNNGAEYDKEIVPKTINIIYQLVQDDKVSREKIHQSAERIRKLKKSIQ